MAKRKRSARNSEAKVIGHTLANVWGVIAWLTGVIVSLAVGFGLVNRLLTVPYIPLIVTRFAGVIVIVLTLLGVSLVLVDKLRK